MAIGRGVRWACPHPLTCAKVHLMCGSRKYPYSPHRRDWRFREGEGISKSQKYKAMCEAKLEFLDGCGVIEQIPSVGGKDIFWNHTIWEGGLKWLVECRKSGLQQHDFQNFLGKYTPGFPPRLSCFWHSHPPKQNCAYGPEKQWK